MPGELTTLTMSSMMSRLRAGSTPSLGAGASIAISLTRAIQNDERKTLLELLFSFLFLSEEKEVRKKKPSSPSGGLVVVVLPTSTLRSRGPSRPRVRRVRSRVL
jgi:hypothetical protein